MSLAAAALVPGDLQRFRELHFRCPGPHGATGPRVFDGRDRGFAGRDHRFASRYGWAYGYPYVYLQMLANGMTARASSSGAATRPIDPADCFRTTTADPLPGMLPISPVYDFLTIAA